MNPNPSRTAKQGFVGATSLRWSRLFTLAFIAALSTVILIIIVTSELEGPGSGQNLVVAAVPTASATNPANTVSATTASLASSTKPVTTETTNTVPATTGQAAVAPAMTPSTGISSGVAITTATANEAAPVKSCKTTESMPGGNNLYVRGAPVVENLGTGFVVSGVVLDENCKPVPGIRIQIWLNTSRGGEGLPSNRGSVITDENGRYRLETLPVVPQFGQPHVHIAYDDGVYKPLFLRSVLQSKDDPSITVDFVLQRNEIPN